MYPWKLKLLWGYKYNLWKNREKKSTMLPVYLVGMPSPLRFSMENHSTSSVIDNQWINNTKTTLGTTSFKINASMYFFTFLLCSEFMLVILKSKFLAVINIYTSWIWNILCYLLKAILNSKYHGDWNYLAFHIKKHTHFLSKYCDIKQSYLIKHI